MPTKSVAEDFVDHCFLGGVQHFPPPNGKGYPPCQTTHCTNVAVELYNAQVNSSKKIKNAVGVDSNMFILDQEDPMNYWHLYFKGKVGRKPCKFFAELSGLRAPEEQSAELNGAGGPNEQSAEPSSAGGPTELRICQLVDKAVAASVVNCDHCFGGIWHPLEGFLGCKTEEGREEDARVHDHGAPGVAASTSSSAATDPGETQAGEGPESQPAKRTCRPPLCQ